MTLLGALGVAAMAETTAVQASNSKTVWKERVLARGSSAAPHQQAKWSPYRTGDFGAKVQTVSNSQSGTIVSEEMPLEMGPPVYGDSCTSCGPGMSCDSCGSCGTMSCGGCGECDACTSCYDCGAFGAMLAHIVMNLNYFGGVHGFKGATDLGRNGNFGFNYGLNWGSPLGDPWGLGYQVGVGVVHSNFTGDQVIDLFSGDHRDQVFFTSGIFRRAMCGGIQWGVVYDLMRDSYRDNATTGQIRTEIAFSTPGCRDFGFYGVFGASDDRMTLPLVNQVITEVDVAPLDIYSLFYRRYFTGGGIGRVWAGFTNEGDGVFGADATIPLGTSWALENSFTYLAPQDSGLTKQERESWGVFIRLVWYPGRQASCEINDPYTPLMPVANNTNMLIDVNQR